MILSIALAQAENPPGFKPGPASSYAGHQKVGKVTFAAVKYESDEECKTAFGKVNPNEYGVLPIFLIIDNGGGETLLLDRMEVSYQSPDRQVLDPVPAKELPAVLAPKRPGSGPTYPLPIPLPKKKNPLRTVELETRSFAARTVLAGDSASGFLYFLTRHKRGSILYVRGVREGGTGQELFFVEIPIDTPTQ